jgi:diamine N-acetyltransferase
MPTVTLVPLTDANREELVALRTAPSQERFVSTVADSLLEAEQEPDGRAIAFGVYDGDRPVGFVMVADDVGSDEYYPRYLWKLLIDERYQRMGYGTAALDEVFAFFRSRPGEDRVLTSAGQGEGSPIPFYERYGFVRTGEVVFDDEVLLRKPLDPP